MKRAIRQAFEDARGKISRRAITLYILLGMLVASDTVNLCNNKNILNSNQEGHLYLLITIVITSIFADPLVNKKNSNPPAGPPPGQP